MTAAEFAEIYADCGFSGAMARDEASLSYVYELSPALRVLMLDVNTAEAPQAVKDETLAWAEGRLADAAAAGAKVIAVSHQNLFRHNKVIYEGYVIKNADALRTLYERYGVLVNLTGHLHCQHIAHNDAGFYEIATSSLAVSPCQYGVLRLSEHSPPRRATRHPVFAGGSTPRIFPGGWTRSGPTTPALKSGRAMASWPSISTACGTISARTTPGSRWNGKIKKTPAFPGRGRPVL